MEIAEAGSVAKCAGRDVAVGARASEESLARVYEP